MVRGGDKRSIDLCVLLAGGLKAPPIVRQSGCSVLDLYLQHDRSVMDIWLDRLGELVEDAARPIPVKVVYNAACPAPKLVSDESRAGVRLEREQGRFRGPGTPRCRRP